MAIIFERINLGKNYDQLIIKLEPSEFLPEFEKECRTIANKAVIPGFRTGKVPIPYIKKLYGKSIYAESIVKKIEHAINDYTKQNPFLIAPIPFDENFRNLDYNNPTLVEVNYHYTPTPVFNLDLNHPIYIDKYNIEITDKMVDDEIDFALDNNKFNVEKELVEGDEDIVNIDFYESLDNVIEPFPINCDLEFKNLSTEQKELFKGQKAEFSTQFSLHELGGEQANNLFSKIFPANFDFDQKLYLKIYKVFIKTKPELNKETFNLITKNNEIETLEQLKNHYYKTLEKDFITYTNSRLQKDIFILLYKLFKLEIDVTPIKLFLEIRDKDYPNLDQENKTLKELEFIKMINKNLILDNLFKTYDIQINNEDIINYIKRILENEFFYKTYPQYLEMAVSKILSEQNSTSYYSHLASKEKLSDYLCKNIFVFNEKLISLDEFKTALIQNNQEYNEEF